MPRPQVLRLPASEMPAFRTQMLQQQFTGPVQPVPPAGGAASGGDSPPAGQGAAPPPGQVDPPAAPPVADPLAAYNGLTPEQVAEMAAELEQSRREKMTADQKAVEDAAAKAKADADAAWKPKLLAAQLRSSAAATGRLTAEQLKTFLDGANPGAFVAASGDIDDTKVSAHLAMLFTDPRVPPVTNGGQFGSPPPVQSNRARGDAEADRRFGAPAK